MKNINTFELKNRISSLLLEFPELAEDESLRLDTLEGETNFNEVMTMILENINLAVETQDGIEERIKKNKARKSRFESQEAAWRKLAKELMEQANLRKLQLTEATLSIRAGQPSVVIMDEDALPEAFWRIKREPNVAKIKETLKEGGEVSGAVLNNSPDTLAILNK